MCLIVFSFLKFVINYVSYFDIFKCCSVNNHLIFIHQYCFVFLFLSLLFHLYFRLGPRPICLPIFQAQKETYNSRPAHQSRPTLHLELKPKAVHPSAFLPCTTGTCMVSFSPMPRPPTQQVVFSHTLIACMHTGMCYSFVQLALVARELPHEQHVPACPLVDTHVADPAPFPFSHVDVPAQQPTIPSAYPWLFSSPAYSPTSPGYSPTSPSCNPTTPT